MPKKYTQRQLVDAKAKESYVMEKESGGPPEEKGCHESEQQVSPPLRPHSFHHCKLFAQVLFSSAMCTNKQGWSLAVNDLRRAMAAPVSGFTILPVQHRWVLDMMSKLEVLADLQWRIENGASGHSAHVSFLLYPLLQPKARKHIGRDAACV
eukprot:55537-Eustigmatos_ZCMA.PRE.1